MLRRISLVLWLVTLPALASAQTRVDFERHKDFNRYKTFTLEVVPPVRTDGAVDEHNTLAEGRLREAVTREFLARGLEPTDGTADLTVRVSSRETERTVVERTGWDPYPYRWGLAFPVGLPAVLGSLGSLRRPCLDAALRRRGCAD